MTNIKKFLFRFAVFAFAAIFICVFAAVCVNFYIKGYSEKFIVSAEDAYNTDADCIVVLGAGIINSTTPTSMLKDRLDTAIDIYKNGKCGKIIMSGDHGTKEYNEVSVMKNYAIEHGVPSEDIFMDHTGFSTYDTMYRAKEVFGAESALVVTQKYHLYRALYIANKLGINAMGVCADTHIYRGQILRDIREVAARAKDFAYILTKPNPTFLGESIPVSGNGDVTNDY